MVNPGPGRRFRRAPYLPKGYLGKGLEMETIKNFLRDEAGASAVEYGLMVALIAVVITAAVTTLGSNLSIKFSTVATTIGSAS